MTVSSHTLHAPHLSWLQICEAWFPLHPSGSKESGEIRLALQFIPSGPDVKPSQRPRPFNPAILQAIRAPTHEGQIMINVMEAKHLRDVCTFETMVGASHAVWRFIDCVCMSLGCLFVP